MVVKVWGGLGNQMFQYAFARSLAEIHQTQVWLDCTALEVGKGSLAQRDYGLSAFNIELPLASVEIINAHKKISNIQWMGERYVHAINLFPFLFKHYLIEKKLNYNQNNLKKYSYYQGYWQTEKYFSNIRELVVKDFSLQREVELISSVKDIFNELTMCESASIHIRRGDYVNNKTAFERHGLLSPSYYESGMEHLKKNKPGVKFFVFSDDIQWVRANMFQKTDVTFVDSKSQETDFLLMSRSKNNIIANSSFSWWAAYLNRNTDKIVIAPKRWFNSGPKNDDIIPENWQCI